MDDKFKKNLQYLSGLSLLQFEAACHFNLTKHLIELFKFHAPQPQYGCERGLNTFIAMGHQLDASVFLYESIKQLSIWDDEECKVFKEQPFYADLEVVRNNIHTYFKNGGFAKKANTIIGQKLKEYKLDKPDVFHMLRSDISLVFEIVDDLKCLIGCDYFIYHCIYESENKEWVGIDYHGYAEFLSSNIKAIALTVDETQYLLSQLHFREKMPVVELFDYKSADLVNCSAVSSISTFRLVLMLYQISYILLLLDEIFDYESINKDDMWACFFSKLLAIKYDEAFDNLQSLLTFSKKDDRRILLEYCKNENLIIGNLVAREFAQKLRNTIHYQTILLDTNKFRENSTRGIVTAIYLSNTDTNSMGEFKNKSKAMILEMKLLQKFIRKIISVDKKLL
ncbi:hypothetical protein [Sinanaerobacter chloroacetimidivorans]|uniref:Uncharacterized protein n=1 Tax=Sinanaerobacter chloroacetimidivorans TaxID=2818044 RepID=A0A8J8B3I1_9FIRM|nr:hypothetical protein [Sinanaerobacter chloroacetimidivorans]MBR0599782.1 hypothetical protein [Sinanaerobacter chloroacetimidivorans]